MTNVPSPLVDSEFSVQLDPDGWISIDHIYIDNSSETFEPYGELFPELLRVLPVK